MKSDVDRAALVALVEYMAAKGKQVSGHWISGGFHVLQKFGEILVVI